ncbi:hypothetical protein ACIOZM_18865 [Pseudomonas sp. NPDC087346]|uniref:hypothetical protein n=1 Tax=Pseudomonas sp. NPDC087346 TaxID=3364438 RepID=UPI00382A0D5E
MLYGNRDKYGRKELTPEEQKIQYDNQQRKQAEEQKELEEKAKTHDYVNTNIFSEIDYMEGQRGGVVFPTLGGNQFSQQKAADIISQMKAGSYKRGDGVLYSYDSFKAAYEEELKNRAVWKWVPKKQV